MRLLLKRSTFSAHKMHLHKFATRWGTSSFSRVKTAQDGSLTRASDSERICHEFLCMPICEQVYCLHC